MIYYYYIANFVTLALVYMIIDFKSFLATYFNIFSGHFAWRKLL